MDRNHHHHHGMYEKITHWMGSPSSIAVHTLAFLGAFMVGVLGVAPWDMVLLVLTTVVSLEAIYLALFIQMTVNRNTMSLREVEKDVDEIQEDIEEIHENVEEISEDVEDIQKAS
ncbi:MAG: DUF1003 domain-containing protein [Patescibacteria group bacterium]